jgi:uncharacterized membrane protein YphA (DoxX/SURF4 family)
MQPEDIAMEVRASEMRSAPAWQAWLGWTAAVLMAFLWLVAGFWKLSDLAAFQVKMTQLLVPVSLSMPATLALVVSELTAGVLLLVPAWRRLGGLFSAAILLAFMAYMAINYQALRGADCSCFPWVERAVGPVFFWTDGAMVALALVAAWFSRPVARLRQAGFALAGIVAMTGLTFAMEQSAAPAAAGELPAKIQIEGGELAINQGPVFLYFFNPTCLHCLDAGIAMSKYQWKAAYVGIPTQDFDFGPQFVNDAGLKNVKLSPELDRLKALFPFDDVPYAVALNDGKVVAQLRFFEEPELGEKLREIGVVE